MKHSLYRPDDTLQTDRELLRTFASTHDPATEKTLAAALKLAQQAQASDTKVRPRGIDVARILHHVRVDADTLVAALLSDPWIRDHVEERTLERQFGEHMAGLVRKVNWLNTFDEYHRSLNKEPDQAELLRNMLLAVVNDVRAVLIKLAYRLQRLRLLKLDTDEARRRAIAQETLDLFTPIANRLGVSQLKWEMEDLAFRHLEPEAYRHLAKSLDANRAARENFIQHFITELRGKLESAGLTGRVYGRPKHLYSIHRKMERKALALDELYDLHAVRVIVADVPACYAVLSLIHGDWLHIAAEFDDYIAHPKPNGYQSLHTVVVGPEGQPVEIQIRTEDMHHFAEYGVAAHWRYKEGSQEDTALDNNVTTLRKLLENPGQDQQNILDSFRSELFDDQVFVLTPMGQVIRLGKGATPVDFAYGIHTEVGHRCRGAKVNGRMTPLTHPLQSGDRVEIITTRQGGPSLGWLDPHLGYVRTGHARNKIRAWFRQQDHDRLSRAGKLVYDRERQRLGVREADLEELARHFHLPRADDVLLALGRNEITPLQLASALKPPEPRQATTPTPPRPPAGPPSDQITILGVGNLVTHFAHCCDPKPGDRIIGFVSQVRGIAINRQDCTNIQRLPRERQNRLIDVAWGSEPASQPMDIEVRALDRKGLLRDISQILADARIGIIATQSEVNPTDQMATLRITAEASDRSRLNRALNRIGSLPDVLESRRIGR